MADEIDRYPLHRAVFENDLKSLSRLLRKHDVAAKDKHGKWCFIFSLCVYPVFVCIVGNTALHLAVMLGRKGRWNDHYYVY